MNPARAETPRRDPPAWLPQRDEEPVQPEPQPITSNAMTVARLQAGAQPPPAAEGMQAQYGNAAVVRSQPARAAPASRGEGQPAKAAPQAGEKKAEAREAAPGKELPARSGDAGDAF
jgi:hypothetical protein